MRVNYFNHREDIAMKDKWTLDELLRQLYIRACLDALDPKSKGKGKNLCEKRIKIIKREIIKLKGHSK